MVTVEALAQEVRKILEATEDLEQMTVRKVMQKLVETFDASVDEHKQAVKNEIVRVMPEIQASREAQTTPRSPSDDRSSKPEPTGKSQAGTLTANAKSTQEEEEEEAEAEAESSSEDEQPAPTTSRRKSTEAAKARSTAKAEASASKAKAKALAKSAKGTFGNAKPLLLAPPLADFLGVRSDVATISRAEVQKRLREYFAEKGLKNPKDGREILLDEPLQKVFKRAKFTFFTMNKFITPLLRNPDNVTGYGEDDADKSSADDDNSDSGSDKDSDDVPLRGKVAVGTKRKAKGSTSAATASKKKPCGWRQLVAGKREREFVLAVAKQTDLSEAALDKIASAL